MFFFGGYSGAAGLHNDVHILQLPCAPPKPDPNEKPPSMAAADEPPKPAKPLECAPPAARVTAKWRKTILQGPSPIPRFGHSMVPAMEGTMVMVIGGFGAGSDDLNWRRRKSLAGYRNDLFLLDPMIPNITSVSPRHGPALGGHVVYEIVPRRGGQSDVSEESENITEAKTKSPSLEDLASDAESALSAAGVDVEADVAAEFLEAWERTFAGSAHRRHDHMLREGRTSPALTMALLEVSERARRAHRKRSATTLVATPSTESSATMRLVETSASFSAPYNLIKQGKTCGTQRTAESGAQTVGECAEACVDAADCRFFSFGVSNGCFRVDASSASCAEGWMKTEGSDFYAIYRGVPNATHTIEARVQPLRMTIKGRNLGTCASFDLVQGVLRCNETCTRATCNDEIWHSNNENVIVMVGPSRCNNLTWYSESHIECSVPPGIGAGHDVVVYANGQSTPQLPHNRYFDYDPPEIHQTVPKFILDFPDVPRGPVVIMGKNFGGYADESLEVTIAGEKCLRLHWMSDGLLVCLCVDRANPPGVGMSAPTGVTVKVGGLEGAYSDFSAVQVPVVLSDEFSGEVRCPPARELASLLLAPNLELLAQNLEHIDDVLSKRWPPSDDTASDETNDVSSASSTGVTVTTNSVPGTTNIDEGMRPLTEGIERLKNAGDLDGLRVLLMSSLDALKNAESTLHRRGSTATAASVSQLVRRISAWRDALGVVEGTKASHTEKISSIQEAAKKMQSVVDMIKGRLTASSASGGGGDNATTSPEAQQANATIVDERKHLENLLADLTVVENSIRKSESDAGLLPAIATFNKTVQNMSSAIRVWGGGLSELIAEIRELAATPPQDIPIARLQKLKRDLDVFAAAHDGGASRVSQDAAGVVADTSAKLEATFEPLAEVANDVEELSTDDLLGVTAAENGASNTLANNNATADAQTSELLPRVKEYNDALSAVKNAIRKSAVATASGIGNTTNATNAAPTNATETVEDVVKNIVEKMGETIAAIEAPSKTVMVGPYKNESRTYPAPRPYVEANASKITPVGVQVTMLTHLAEFLDRLVDAEEHGTEIEPLPLSDLNREILSVQNLNPPAESKSWSSSVDIGTELDIKGSSNVNLQRPIDVAAEKSSADVESWAAEEEAKLAAAAAVGESSAARFRSTRRRQSAESRDSSSCFVPLGTSWSEQSETMYPCHCDGLMELADRSGVVAPSDVPSNCRADVERFAYSRGCVAMRDVHSGSCSDAVIGALQRFRASDTSGAVSRALLSTVPTQCSGMKVTMKSICGDESRGWSPALHRRELNTSRPDGLAVARFASKSASISVPAKTFLTRWTAVEARFRERRDPPKRHTSKNAMRFQGQQSKNVPPPTGAEQFLRPSNEFDTFSRRRDDKDESSDIPDKEASLEDAIANQPIALKWVSPDFVCEDGKPPPPRRSFACVPIANGAAFALFGGVGLNGGLGLGNFDDQTSVFSGVRFSATSIPMPAVDFNDTFILIERFKDPNAECWAPEPKRNETKDRENGVYVAPSDASYPNRTRAYPDRIDDGCGADNPNGIEDGNNNCCSPSNPCSANHGDCDKDEDCAGSLVCGWHNCPWKMQLNGSTGQDDCCWSPFLPGAGVAKHGAHTMKPKGE